MATRPSYRETDNALDNFTSSHADLLPLRKELETNLVTTWPILLYDYETIDSHITHWYRSHLLANLKALKLAHKQQQKMHTKIIEIKNILADMLPRLP